MPHPQSLPEKVASHRRTNFDEDCCLTAPVEPLSARCRALAAWLGLKQFTERLPRSCIATRLADLHPLTDLSSAVMLL